MNTSGSIQAELAGTPDEIRELLGIAAQSVKVTTGLDLDFSSETLPLVDFYLSEARKGLLLRPEAGELVARALGAYFGQTLINCFEGFWMTQPDRPERWFVCFTRSHLALNPVGVALECLLGRSGHDGPPAEILVEENKRNALAARLELIPEVREEEYYLLSTRYDIFEIAHEAIREIPNAEEEEEEEVQEPALLLEPDDYHVLLDWEV